MGDYSSNPLLRDLSSPHSIPINRGREKTLPYLLAVHRYYRTGISGLYTVLCMYGHHTWQSMDQPGKVANPARGQLNKEKNIPLSPCVPENLVSRDGFSRPVPRQPAHLHTQAESGACLRDSSRIPRRRPVYIFRSCATAFFSTAMIE